MHRPKSNDLLYIFIDLLYQRKHILKNEYRKYLINTIIVSGGPYEPTYADVINELIDGYDKIERIFSEQEEEDINDIENLLDFF
jgi:hypothetical protein